MCGELGIEVKLSVSQSAMNENSVINDGGYPHQPFSSANFVDVLVELIVGDDLVSVTPIVVVL